MVNCGGSVTHAVPIYEGYVLPDAILRMDVGGNDLDYFMRGQLLHQGYSEFTRENAKTLKEGVCCVSMEKFSWSPPENLRGVEHERRYELPDGKVVTGTLIFKTTSLRGKSFFFELRAQRDFGSRM